MFAANISHACRRDVPHSVCNEANIHAPATQFPFMHRARRTRLRTAEDVRALKRQKSYTQHTAAVVRITRVLAIIASQRISVAENLAIVSGFRVVRRRRQRAAVVGGGWVDGLCLHMVRARVR